MIGPSFSVAIEKRSSVSRAPVRSSELTRTRQRIHRNARKMRPIVQSQSRSAAGRSPPTSSMNISSSVPLPCAPARTSVDAPLRDEPAVGDDADVRREPLDDFEDVRRQEHRPAARDERVQQFLDLSRRDRVDAFERLVEEQQPRRRQQRRRERQLLAHAVREVGDQRRRRRLSDPSATAGPRSAARASRAACRAPAPTKLSVSAAVRRSNSARSSGTTPTRRLISTGSTSGSMPRMRMSPPDGRSRPGQALDRRRLAGAVGPEEAVEAAGRHLQVDAVDGALRSERARQPACLDSEFHQPGLYVSMTG